MSVIAKLGDSVLYASDFYNFTNEKAWLNDHNLLFWQQYLQLYRFADFESQFTFLQPAAAFSMMFIDTEDLLTDTPDNVFRSLSSKQLILIPVVTDASAVTGGGSHWTLVVYVKGVNDRLFHFDSGNSFKINNESVKIIATKLKDVLGLENTFQLTNMSCPQQTNGYDCGVHVCINAECILEQSLEKNLSIDQISIENCEGRHRILQTAKSFLKSA